MICFYNTLEGESILAGECKSILLYDDIDKKLESKINKKLISKSKKRHLDDGFKKGKVINEVLDKPTVMTLYNMIRNHIIAYVNGAVSAGKESVLCRTDQWHHRLRRSRLPGSYGRDQCPPVGT